MLVELAGLAALGSLFYYRRRAATAENELDKLQKAVLRICASADSKTKDWKEQRQNISQLLGQGNTYSTWSLSLVNMLEAPLLFHDAGQPRITPASLGVTRDSTPNFLKALDLGGGDQRTIFAHLEEGKADAAQTVLVDNKKGDSNRSYILTGGPLQKRLDAAAKLRAVFPNMTFAAIDPEDEGRLTLRASHEEIQRLLVSSDGAWTHALLLAKGSTDLHLAWLEAQGGIASDAGQAVSAVHRLQKTDPSEAKGIFEEFMGRPCNATLLQACNDGRCAIIFAGASVFALGGADVAAAGDYFARLAPKDAQAADDKKADFEKFVALEWGVQATAGEPTGAGGPNPVFVGATGPRKSDR